MKAPATLIGRGILAGLAGGVALAAWFFIIDALSGKPFDTPVFLATAAGLDEVRVGALMIALYTIIHFALWILVGLAMAWLVSKLDAVPPVISGLVLGFLLFDLVFYGSLVLTGVDIVEALGWRQVLVGNLIAGVALFGVLSLMGAIEPYDWAGGLRRHRTLQEGVITGLIGAVLVAAWFLLYDVVAGRILYTPAALGSAVFLGARSTAEVQISAMTVLGYTLIHVVAFLITGLIAAAVVWAAEEYDEVLLLGAVLLFVTFEALSIGLLTIVSSWLLEALTWWNIAVANLIAAIAMGAYLYHRHPALVRDVQDRDFEEDLANDRPAPGVHSSAGR